VEHETESEPDVPAPGWFPRWVLASYGVALGVAGLTAADQSELPAQLRALGVSSFVLGAGCLLLAVRQKPAVRQAAVETVEVVELEPQAERAEEDSAEADSGEPEAPTAIPNQPVSDDLEAVEPEDEDARLERLEAELADERARVDRVTAELAALKRVVVEQRQKSRSS